MWQRAAGRGDRVRRFQQELKQEITVLALTDRRMQKYFPGQMYYLVINLPLGPSEAKRVMPAWFPNNSLNIELNLYHKEM